MFCNHQKLIEITNNWDGFKIASPVLIIINILSDQTLRTKMVLFLLKHLPKQGKLFDDEEKIFFYF